METIRLNYPHATRRTTGRAHVGVVGSGDLEILLSASPDTGTGADVSITTAVAGFSSTWKAVFDRFFSQYDGAVVIEINDAGATPGSVMLRLQQAIEKMGA